VRIAAFVRVALVVFLVAMNLGFALPDVARPFHPMGDLGFRLADFGKVSSVVSGSPAARAHIAPGDALVLPTLQDRVRWDVILANELYPGDRETLTVARGDTRRSVTLTAGTFTRYPDWLAVLRALLEAFWVLLVAFLVLRRPNVMTWSLFFFSIFPKIAPMAISVLSVPPYLNLVYNSTALIMKSLSEAAGIVFVLSLGAYPVPRWHWIAGIIFVPLFIILNLPGAIALVLWLAAGISHSIFDFALARTYGYAVGLIWGVTVLALLGTIYAENRGKDRQRLLWVMVGFAIYLFVKGTAVILPPGTPYILVAILYTLQAAFPLCVTYAILKHRLVDIHFVVSQALIFGIISTCIIAVLAFIDWLFSKVLDSQRLGAFAQVAAAIAFGFWFNHFHQQVDRFVDAVFFRKKHRADVHLRALAKGLPHATCDQAITQVLVDEPTEALDLASAALFKRNGSTNFKRVHARGWAGSTPAELMDRDLTALRLQNYHEAFVLDPGAAQNVNLSQGSATPDVVLPIFVHNELVAVAFYGCHKHGEHLDRDEIQTIGGFAVAASAAYAHLESRELRREVEDTRSQTRQMEIESLRRQNDALRRGSR
jgi:hypothetical protein